MNYAVIPHNTLAAALNIYTTTTLNLLKRELGCEVEHVFNLDGYRMVVMINPTMEAIEKANREVVNDFAREPLNKAVPVVRKDGVWHLA